MLFSFSEGSFYETTEAGGFHIRVVRNQTLNRWEASFCLGPVHAGDVVEMGRVNTQAWLDDHPSVFSDAEVTAAQALSASGKWETIFSLLIAQQAHRHIIDFCRHTPASGSGYPRDTELSSALLKLTQQYFG